MNREPTNGEILGAVTALATRIEQVEGNTLEAIHDLAQSMDERFQEVHAEIGGMKSEIGGMKSEIGGMKVEIRSMKAVMVTKDYLDEKLADHHSDIVNHVKKLVPIWVKSGV